MIEHIPDINEFPLSFAQQRLWFLDQYDPHLQAYNMPYAYRLIGDLNLESFRQSFTEIIRRHASFRTTFKIQNSEPVQLISPEIEIPFRVIKLDEINISERETRISEILKGEFNIHFDLSEGPLIRCSIYKFDQYDHLLCINMHHIISDGWSIGIFNSELSKLYELFTQDEESPLPELSIQYPDFAVWQRKSLDADFLESQLSYWAEQLEEYPSIEFPLDKVRPPIQTYSGAKYQFRISPENTERIISLSNNLRCTLFMTLFSAFNVLLYRYTNQNDICVGIPIANRNVSEIEPLIGFFANTLVLRSNLSGDPTFKEFLLRVREMSISAFTNQDLPFEKLVEVINPERDLSRNPLFQFLFVMQNAPSKPFQLVGVDSTKIPIKSESTHFDFELHIWRAKNDLVCTITYNTDLIDHQTITRFASHYQVLITSVTNNLASRISQLPFIPLGEEILILKRWNNTSVKFDHELCTHNFFENQVEKSPNATAVIYPELEDGQFQSLTYETLNNRANQIANYLIDQGVGPDSTVAIFIERSIELIIGVLGILKAGGAYVPLDPSYPEERLRYMVSETKSKIILTHEPLMNELPQNDAKIINLDLDWNKIQKSSSKNPQHRVSLRNLIYILFTSGSTGKPKGIAMRHGSMINLILDELKSINNEFVPVVLMFNSISFDASFIEIFLALCSGGKLVIVPEEIRSDFERVGRLILNNEISLMFLPYIALNQLAIEFNRKKQLPKSLRKISSTAEQLHITPEIRRLFHNSPLCNLHNAYGPTETHVATILFLEKNQDEWDDNPSIGKPIQNTQIYILNHHLQTVPIGVHGDLYIGGDGLARGYFNQPGVTAEKFIPNPFSLKPGTRLYKTGDLARYKPDGNIEFLGRMDHQIKIRGYRIELGEIEAVLGKANWIKESVVTTYGTTSADKKLAAYIVPNDHETQSTNSIRAFLKSSLPDYMIPSQFIFLDKMPLTPSGKLDRHSLPIPDRNRPDLDVSYEEPKSKIEAALVFLWAEIIGIEKVGVNDNFFDLGGHSLLATRIISRIRKLFSIPVPLRSIFEFPTITEFSDYILTLEVSPGQIEIISDVIVSIQNMSPEEIASRLYD